MLYGPCIICVYFKFNFFYLHNILKKVFGCGFIILFLCGFCLLLLHLTVCFVSL
jgi:hypothetical protein